MQPISQRSRSSRLALHGTVAVFCAALLVPGNAWLLAQQAPSAAATAPEQAAMLPADQLDSLVAPIALYPDPLLAQTLAASTYPLEIIQLQQWLAQEPEPQGQGARGRGGQAALGPERPVDGGVPGRRQAARGRHPVDDRPRQRLPRPAERRHGRRPADAEEGQGQGRARVQRAADGVETKVVEQKTVIIVESANPEVIYVPVVQPDGRLRPPPVYPYPPIYYPPYPAGRGVRHLHRRRHDAARPSGAAPAAAAAGAATTSTSTSTTTSTGTTSTPATSAAEPGRREQLAAQLPAPRRRPVRQQGHGEQVRRHGPRRLPLQPAGERQAAAGARRRERRASRARRQRAARGEPAGAAAGGGGGSRERRQQPRAARARASAAAARARQRLERQRGSRAERELASKGGGFGGGSSGYSGSSARASSSRGASSYRGRRRRRRRWRRRRR